MSNKPVPLRPHHGMCLAYFIGEGYSSGFTAHMQSVLDHLTPAAPVRPIIGTDTICAACPHNSKGVCTSADRVSRYDQAVLDLCGLENGTVLPFARFTALVQRCILTPGRRSAICGSCQWDKICAAQPSRWAQI